MVVILRVNLLVLAGPAAAVLLLMQMPFVLGVLEDITLGPYSIMDAEHLHPHIAGAATSALKPKLQAPNPPALFTLLSSQQGLIVVWPVTGSLHQAVRVNEPLLPLDMFVPCCADDRGGGCWGEPGRRQQQVTCAVLCCDERRSVA